MLKEKKGLFILISVLVIFVVLHVSGLRLPYHQDEYKWVMYTHPEMLPPGTVPHPPLAEFIYNQLGPIVGDDNFRLIPSFFGILNLFLLFYLVKYLYDKKTAFIAVTIFTLSFYSLLSTLMVDVDGAVMPFFFLILLIGYFKWKEFNFELKQEHWRWIILGLVGAIGGFMVKMSALLPIAAVALDFAVEKKVFADKKRLIRYVVGIAGVTVTLLLILVSSKFIFPFFKLDYSIQYWEHFANSSSFLDRGWFQTIIQCVKILLYSSPFFISMALVTKKADFVKLRVLGFFLALAFIFYVVLFDFSIGALDRYGQLIILPLTIFSAVVLSRLDFRNAEQRKWLIGGALFSLVLVFVQFVPHYAPPLYPKSEWISRVLSLRWNFVYPFSGGSGPMGFYVSFLFMALAWLVSLGAIVLSKVKTHYRELVIVFILPIGLVYNAVFMEEYLLGLINGNAPRLLKNAVEVIKNDPTIKSVVVYNDNGGWNVRQTGKYSRRLYATPQFEESYKDFLLNFKGYVLVVEIPRISPGNFYSKYLDSCKSVYEERDRQIIAQVYDCRGPFKLK